MRGWIVPILWSPMFMVQAQTMQFSDAPVVGDVVRYVMLDGDADITAGSDQQWQLTGEIEYIGDESTFVPVTGAPGSVDFPLATIAVQQAGWDGAAYFRASANGLELIGNHEVPGPSEVYTDTDRWLPYPCSYGTTWTDGYTILEEPGGDTADHIEPTVWTADGYGSLTGPAGTFENVLKCHTVRTFMFIVAGDTTSSTTVVIDRFWKPGHPTYVAEVRQSTYVFGTDPPTQNTSIELLDELAIGVTESSVASTMLELFPNPAATHVQAVYAARGPVDILLTDALGHIVRRVADPTKVPGIRRSAIDLNGLPAGQYFVRVMDRSGLRSVRAFIRE